MYAYSVYPSLPTLIFIFNNVKFFKKLSKYLYATNICILFISVYLKYAYIIDFGNHLHLIITLSILKKPGICGYFSQTLIQQSSKYIKLSSPYILITYFFSGFNTF